MRFLKATFVVFLLLLSVGAEARRHRKFKGVIIVNQILKLDGHVTRNGEDAPEYSGVKQGDLLETPEKSSAVIRIPGLAILRMGANTKLKLTQFNDRNESRFELLGGDLVALFRRVGDHEVKLPLSVIKLHGTTFLATVKDSKTEQIRLDEGKISVSLRKSTVTLKPTPTAEPTPVASPLFHASLTAVATPQPNPTVAVKPAPTPNPTPGLPGEVQLVASGEAQFCEITSDGINLKPENKLDDKQSEIKELDSLYALP